MPVIQSRYMETGQTVLAIGSTKSTMGINPHQICDGTSRTQWVQNYHDVHRLFQ